MARERARMTVDRAGGRDYDPDMLVPPKRGGRQLMVGAFVLVGLIAVLLALFSLTDPGTFRGRYVIYTIVPNAGGIRKGDPVQIRGVNVGRVKGFKIGANAVVVALELEKQYRVPADSRMTLTSSGLLGGMTATITPGTRTEDLVDGDTIPGAQAAGAFDQVGTLGQKADSVLARTQALLSSQMVTDLNASGSQLRALLTQTAAMVAEDRATIRTLTQNLASTTAELQAGHPGRSIGAATARLDSLTNQLSVTSNRLNTASASLQVILGRMEKGEGTLGKLSADPTLYNNLNGAAASFRDLAQDIKANPKKYISVKVF